MATSSILFLVVIGMPFLVGRVSYRHKLGNISSNEGERQGCSNVNCLGRPNCNSPDTCTSLPHQCCIDVINGDTCCYVPGIATHATTTPTTASPTTSPTTASPTPSPTTVNPTTTLTTGEPSNPIPASPFCKDYTQSPSCADSCICTKDVDCFENEICCFVESPLGSAAFYQRCYLRSPLLQTGGKCLSSATTMKCETNRPSGTCDFLNGKTNCLNTEVCCKIVRDAEPCCVRKLT